MIQKRHPVVAPYLPLDYIVAPNYVCISYDAWNTLPLKASLLKVYVYRWSAKILTTRLETILMGHLM